MYPRPAGTGIVFLRTDHRPAVPIHARVENVTGTQRRTTLGRPPNHVGLVEHVLATLSGLRIDNCVVQLNAPEPPGLDGSARSFVEILRASGTVLQAAPGRLDGRRSSHCRSAWRHAEAVSRRR